MKIYTEPLLLIWPLVIHKTTYTRYSSPKWKQNRKEASMKTVNKYINYLNEIMQDHWENNKSIYNVDDEETSEWKSVDRMNNKIMWIVRDYFEEKNKK